VERGGLPSVKEGGEEMETCSTDGEGKGRGRGEYRRGGGGLVVGVGGAEREK